MKIDKSTYNNLKKYVIKNALNFETEQSLNGSSYIYAGLVIGCFCYHKTIKGGLFSKTIETTECNYYLTIFNQSTDIPEKDIKALSETIYDTKVNYQNRLKKKKFNNFIKKINKGK